MKDRPPGFYSRIVKSDRHPREPFQRYTWLKPHSFSVSTGTVALPSIGYSYKTPGITYVYL